MHTALLPVNPIEILIYTSCDFTFFPNTHMSATLLSVSSKGPSTKSPTFQVHDDFQSLEGGDFQVQEGLLVLASVVTEHYAEDLGLVLKTLQE